MCQMIKKVMLMAASLMAVVFFTTIDAKAAEVAPSSEDYGEPINVTTYVDEETGCVITERLYFCPDTTEYDNVMVSVRSASGSGWFKNEKEIKWAGSDNKSTYYAQGYFTWGNGNVSVSNESGGIDYIPSLQSISNEETKTGHGQYLGIFNNYATVTYSFTMTSAVGMSTDYSVTVRVSESGNQI